MYTSIVALTNQAWFVFPTGCDSYRDDLAVTFTDSDLLTNVMAFSQFSAAKPMFDPTPIKAL